MKQVSLTQLILLLVFSNSLFAQTPKVLIIGIDGCRVDALEAANIPNIDQLTLNSTYSYDALTEAPTWSGVGWSGMLTGVWRHKHGVSNNSFSGSNFSAYPHFFNHLEACNANLVSASIVHWGPINTQIVDVVDYGLIVSTDLEVRQQAVSYLSGNNPDVLFLHFDDVDHAGHANGFSPAISQYITAIEQTDVHIGNILTAIENRTNYANEEWAIIISTDHGGTLSGHGGSSFEERSIFTIFSGDAFSNEQLIKSSTNSNIDHALSLNGSDNYINLPTNPVYDFGNNQDFTIECRVRVNSISGDPVILSNKNWNSGLNSGFVFSFTNNGPNWKVNIGDGSDRVDITGGAIDDGNWHHLVASFDRDGLLKMYQNGSLVEEKNLASIDNINSGLPLTIGQDGTHSYGDWFDGEIGEVRIWNTVLSEATISANACTMVTNAHPAFSNLIGYWRINIGDGTVIKDASSYGNNGNLEGSAATWLTGAGNISCYDYSTMPKIVDIATTALNYLCGSIDPSWDLDGQSIPFTVPLPVELIEFSGKAKTQTNHLNWKVSNEEDLKSYIVERIDENGVARQIGEILPDLQHADIKQYHFIDEYPLSKNYYRLRIVNLDETVDYSKIIVVERPASRFNLQVQPIPVKDNLRVSFECFAVREVVVSVHNYMGQLLEHQKVNGQIGTNVLMLDFGKYPAGQYLISLNNGSEVLREKVVK